MPMTPYELLGRLPGIVERLRATPPVYAERGILEVKGWCESKNQLSKEAADAAICLANAEGGILLVGIDAERVIEEATPCPHEAVTPEWLQESVRCHSHPPVECAACRLGDAVPAAPAAAKQCIVLLVPKKAIAGSHRTDQGVCLIRRGGRCEVDHLTSQDDYTSVLLDGGGTDNLSTESLDWAFTNQVVRPRQPQRWRESGRSIDDLLVDFNLVRPRETGAALTLAAALLFGTREFLSRASGSAFLRVTVNGSGGTSPEPYTIHIQQNIVDTFRDLWTSRGDITALTASSVPEKCLRELMVNALLHRSYRSSEPVNVRITPDHLLEIQNPGGFLRNLGPRNLINASPVHRNPLLTEAAALLGFCEKSGSGIDIVYQEAVASGHDFPYFDGDSEAFTALLPLETDANFAQFVRYRGKDFTRLESLLILKHLHRTPQADIGRLARVIERPVEFTESLLQELVRRLVIQQDHGRFSLSGPVRDEIDYPLDRDQGNLF